MRRHLINYTKELGSKNEPIQYLELKDNQHIKYDVIDLCVFGIEIIVLSN